MKFFADTANVEEIQEVASWGILDGVTTNPTLIAREQRDPKGLIQEIARIASPGVVNMEVVGLIADDMVREALEYAEWAPNVVVKFPMTVEGVKATRRAAPQGIRVNVTLCFSLPQAIIAAKAGATYISPFVGRLDDVGHVGMDLVRDIVQVYRTYGFATQVLAASLRHPLHVIDAAKAGAHIATCPFSVLQQLFKHPLTDVGLKRFLDDWHALQSQRATAKR